LSKDASSHLAILGLGYAVEHIGPSKPGHSPSEFYIRWREKVSYKCHVCNGLAMTFKAQALNGISQCPVSRVLVELTDLTASKPGPAGEYLRISNLQITSH